MKLNLGLVFGGRSGEHEVSLQSARSIAGAVDRNKYNLLLIAVDKQGNWFLADENDYLENPDDPARIKLHISAVQQIALVPDNNTNRIIRLSDGSSAGKLDVCFPVIHGTFGEDGSLQGFMSILNIPCVGADVLGSAIGMDKLIAKMLLMQEDIPVADWILADKFSDLDKVSKEAADKFGFPVFVKPACSGSSVGVYKCLDITELRENIRRSLHFDSRVLIEEAIIGREIECAILGNDELLASVPGEIISRHAFYSYEAKYIDAEGARLDIPAQLDDKTVEHVKQTAMKAYKVLSCSGMARVDMFLSESGRIVLNEINTLPGFTKISMYPKLIDISGVSYSELIDRLVSLAVDRHIERQQQLENVLNAGAY